MLPTKVALTAASRRTDARSASALNPAAAPDNCSFSSEPDPKMLSMFLNFISSDSHISEHLAVFVLHRADWNMTVIGSSDSSVRL